MPTISVIVPIYNVEKYLNKCIQSIINQTFLDIEIILVNDGSTDRSGEICDNHAKIDSRIKVIHKENAGVSSAGHAGLAVASGEYIGFVGADDWIEPDMYSFLFSLLNEHKADIACCAMNVIQVGLKASTAPADGKIIVYTTRDAVRAILMDHEMQSHVADKLFKRHLFDTFVSPDYSYHEDYASTFKLFARAKKIVVKREAKYNYNFHDDNTCSNLTPIRLYHSFLAHVRRQEYIDTHCDDLSEMNLGRTLTSALRAVHEMIRMKEHTGLCREGFIHIHEWLKSNMYRIRRNTTISRRLIYFARLFVINKSLYVAICKMGIKRGIEKCLNTIRLQ